jgi:hypothetical protein
MGYPYYGMGGRMSNITLSIDDEVIKKVKKIAIDRNTTLTAMVRDYLRSVAEQTEQRKERALKSLQKSFSRLSRDMGLRTWKRSDLYERKIIS